MKPFEHASLITAGFGMATALGVLTETGAKASALLTMISFAVWGILAGYALIKESRNVR